MAYPTPTPIPTPTPTPTQNGFAALADPTRREIFERLAAGASPVGELARDLPVSRPAVSQHLKVLKEAGLVVDRRVGNRSIYQLNPAGLGAMHAYLERFWKGALAAFKVAAEERPDPPAPADARQRTTPRRGNAPPPQAQTKEDR